MRKNKVINLGRHKLICGDSTEKETIKTLTEGNTFFNSLITDPPIWC